MAKHLIRETATFIGEWSMPAGAASTTRISGTLTWAGERAVLELHDTFKPMHGAIYGDEVHEYPAIHGLTIESQYISVLNASRSGNSLSIGPAGMRQRERIHSSWVIVGGHVDNKTLYTEIQVRIPGLQIWLGRSGIQRTIYEKSETSPAGMIYRIEGLPEEVFPVASLPITLGWSIGRNFSGDLVSEINVRSSAFLRIHSDTPQVLDWYFSQLGKATTLLAMIAGSPMAPDQITAKVANSDLEVDVLVALRESQSCTHKNIHDFFMLRSGMDVDLGAIFSTWYEKYDSVAMPSQLALSVLSSKDLWLHVEFLSLMQALEGFHRATMSDLYTSAEKYEAIKQSLSAAIPKDTAPDHKESLRSRIRYGNEISLRKRLDALVGRLDAPLRKFILGGDGTVPRRWIDTRNYYTHWDEASKANVLDGLAMHHAHVRMRHLLRALYLDYAGIPQSAIAQSLLNASRESQYLVQLNNAERRRNNPEDMGTPLMQIQAQDAGAPDDPSAQAHEDSPK